MPAQGRASRRRPQSVALGSRSDASQALKGRHMGARSIVMLVWCRVVVRWGGCFARSGLGAVSSMNPGRRCALPWADLSWPFRPEDLNSAVPDPPLLRHKKEAGRGAQSPPRPASVNCTCTSNRLAYVRVSKFTILERNLAGNGLAT